ncbi:MAG: PD40 domain-containing protein [Thermomicrobiales bacterium]|nr:PD40 domain-containing protein [Thermomicrobiales bacterium]
MTGISNAMASKVALAGAGILVLATLAGCAEDEPGPQFANNPPTATAGASAGLPTTVPATPLPAATPVAATPVAIEDVLGTRGAVPRIFLASSESIWAVDDRGNSEEIFSAEPDERVLAIGPSPDARQVAAMVAWDGGRETSLVILDAGGDVVKEVELPGRLSATPAAAQVAGSALVDWSPQGDKILLVMPDDSLLTLAVAADASPESIDPGASGGHILGPSWSPTGQQVAYLRVDPETRSRSLAVYDLASGDTREVVSSTDGRLVVEFAWEPDGKSLLFTEGAAPGGVITGIDLWRIGIDGQGRELVAAAGTAAPVARITNVTPSPDGKSVAYAVLVPGDGTPRVDGVWVRELASGQGFRLGLPSMRSVEGIWWTSRGLAIATVTDRQNEPILAVLLVSPSGNVSALWARPLSAAAPAATPATPPSAANQTQDAASP